MFPLLNAYWDICLRRTTPQSLPTSNTLLVTTLVAYGLIGLLLGLVNLSFIRAFISSIADIILLASMIRLIFWIRCIEGRFTQTLSAFAGTALIINLFALPLFIWQNLAGGMMSGAAFLPSLFLLVLIFWNIAIMGHILRHALNTKPYIGVLFAILYTYISISVIGTLFAIPTA